MSDPQPETGAPEPGAPAEDERRRRRLLFLLLGVLAAILLIAATVLLTLLLSRPASPALPEPSGTPSSPAPTPTTAPPSAVPTPTTAPSTPPPPPPPSGPDGRIVSFTGPSSPGCYAPSAPAFQDSIPISFSWVAQNVSEVAFGVSTADAIDAPYETGLPPSGSIEMSFNCHDSEQSYTLTVRGADGVHVSKTVTVRNPSANG